MFLVQVFLPLYDPGGIKFEKVFFEEVKKKLLEDFDGVTFYEQTPAQGLWKDDEGHVDKDKMITVEVMAENLDRKWWKDYKITLEQVFKQKEILVRVVLMEKI